MKAENSKARIAEIDKWLNAYRQGWVTYDSRHVAQLKRERAKLLGQS